MSGKALWAGWQDMVGNPTAWALSEARRTALSSLGNVTTPQPVTVSPASLNFCAAVRHCSGVPPQGQWVRNNETFCSSNFLAASMTLSGGKLDKETVARPS